MNQQKPYVFMTPQEFSKLSMEDKKRVYREAYNELMRQEEEDRKAAKQPKRPKLKLKKA